VKNGATTIADYNYDANNNLISTTFADGTTETRRYDTRDRLIHTDTQKGSTLLFSADYTLDPNGNRTEVKEQLGATPRTILYSYDALDRLSQEFELNIGFGKIDYSYDNVGNRTKRNRVGSSDVTTYVYDNNDRLLSATTGTYQEITYAYDNNGNTTQETLKQYGTTIQTTTNTWNDKNQLTGVTITRGGTTTTTTYRYDADGIRVASTVNGTETRFLVDPNQPYAQVLEEYSPSGTVQVAYVYGLDLISQTQGGATSYFHTDGLGSTRVLTDSTGNVLNTYNYNPFGEILNSSGTTNNKYLFAGEQFDSTLGDYYLRARFYDPNSGRFTRRDSYEGSLSNPLSLHRYSYAHNNPVNNIDPSGLSIASLLEVGAVATGLIILGTAAYIGFSQAGPPPETLGGFGAGPQPDIPKTTGRVLDSLLDFGRLGGFGEGDSPFIPQGIIDVFDIVGLFAPYFSSSSLGAAGSLPDLTGKTRKEAAEILDATGFSRRLRPGGETTTPGGYEEWRHADGSRVWIAPPDQESKVSRFTPDSKKTRKRIDQYGNVIPNLPGTAGGHDTGEKLIP
jgi:RHS repeat-associated protein